MLKVRAFLYVFFASHVFGKVRSYKIKPPHAIWLFIGRRLRCICGAFACMVLLHVFGNVYTAGCLFLFADINVFFVQRMTPEERERFLEKERFEAEEAERKIREAAEVLCCYIAREIDGACTLRWFSSSGNALRALALAQSNMRTRTHTHPRTLPLQLSHLRHVLVQAEERERRDSEARKNAPAKKPLPAPPGAGGASSSSAAVASGSGTSAAADTNGDGAKKKEKPAGCCVLQ